MPTDPTTRPKRIQRKRTKGWRMPVGAVYVGRPTPWGNPFTVHMSGSREKAVEYFRAFLRGEFYNSWPETVKATYRSAENKLYGNAAAGIAPGEIAAALLGGKDLACWCPLDQPCHADVLLEIANA